MAAVSLHRVKRVATWKPSGLTYSRSGNARMELVSLHDASLSEMAERPLAVLASNEVVFFSPLPGFSRESVWSMEVAAKKESL